MQCKLLEFQLNQKIHQSGGVAYCRDKPSTSKIVHPSSHIRLHTFNWNDSTLHFHCMKNTLSSCKSVSRSNCSAAHLFDIAIAACHWKHMTPVRKTTQAHEILVLCENFWSYSLIFTIIDNYIYIIIMKIFCKLKVPSNSGY